MAFIHKTIVETYSVQDAAVDALSDCEKESHTIPEED